MALPINPLSDNGLAAVANNRVGYLNLPLSSYDIGAPQSGAALGMIKNIQNQQEMAKQGLVNQGALNVSQQQGQNELANTGLLGQNAQTLEGQKQAYTLPFDTANMQSRQQEVNQQGQANQNTAAFQQGQLMDAQQKNAISGQQVGQEGQFQQGQLQNMQNQQQLEQQKMQAAATQQQFNNNLVMNKQQLQKQGAAGSIVAMAYNQYANDPAKFKSWMETNGPVLVKEGVMSQDDLTQYSSMTPDQIHTSALAHVMTAGYAADAKAKGAGGAGGSIPGANMIFGNAPLTSNAQTATQNQAIGAQKSLIDNNKVLSSFDPEMFTYAGNAKSALGDVEGKLGMTGTSATDLKAKQDSFNSNVLQSIMDTLQQQKGVRFNKASVDVLKPEMPTMGPEGDSPQSAWAKVVTLNQRMERANEIASNLMSQGIIRDPNSKEGLAKIQEQMPSMSDTPGTVPYVNKDGSTRQLGYDDIKNIADGEKLPFGQAFNLIQQQNISRKQSNQSTPQVQ